MRTKDPKFKTSTYYSGKPKFANEFSFRFFASKEPVAEVFPEGSRELSSAIGRVGYHHWRFSKFGPVFLAHRLSDLIFLNLPRSEAVMVHWFRERGWKVSLSGPGRIAKQLLMQLGGIHSISQLAHRDIIELLRKSEKEEGILHSDVFGRLNRIVLTGGFYDPARLLKALISSNALILGAKIQCPICTRHNWYQLNALGYELRCRYCLSDYSPPLESPKDIQWTYRAHGPFVSPVAQGAFTVLLTLRLLAGDIDRGVTPLFSYNAERDGIRLEADLTCLYKPSTWREKGTYIIHVECKSFNKFEHKDIERMKDLAAAFPGAALVFATLSERLKPSEVKLISKLVLSERKKLLRNKVNSPVIVFTGIELFSHSIYEAWNGKGGLYDRYSQMSYELTELNTLADATQHLYLDLQPSSDLFIEEWIKSSVKVNSKKD